MNEDNEILQEDVDLPVDDEYEYDNLTFSCPDCHATVGLNDEECPDCGLTFHPHNSMTDEENEFNNAGYGIK